MKKIEIALKIEHESQIDNIDITKTGYQYQNDLSDYFNSIYFSAVSRFFEYSVERIYFGAEFCELRIPDYRTVERILQKCEKSNLKFTFLTPPVTEYGLVKIKNLMPLLQQYHCEISVNDYGVLYLFYSSGYQGKLISGRLLDKMYHDGRMNTDMYQQYSNENGQNYLKSPAVAAKYYQSFLSNYAVCRYDIDIPIYGIDLSSGQEKISFSAFLPYGYVTTGRVCMMRNYGQENYTGFDLTTHQCAKQCRTYDQLMIQPVSGIQKNENQMRNRSMYMMRKGNTIFYGTALSPKDEMQFDRIIIQQTLML